MARHRRQSNQDVEVSGDHWISYSDLMAGLLMLFALILTLSMVASSQEHEASIQKLEEQRKVIEAQQKEIARRTARAEQRLGIRRDIIEALRQKLKDYNVKIDPQTGAIVIAADILFGQDEAEVSESGKAVLNDVMAAYASILLDDEMYRRHLSRIIIEGHTNDDGEYLYNLNLSQQRAYNVMRHIIKFYAGSPHEELLKHYLVASGRSEMDLIRRPDGTVDKEKSRRIQIKFSLKDEDTIKELLKLFEQPL